VQQGAYISGIAHVALILWALIGGFFLSRSDPLPVETMDVSILSTEEFDALSAPKVPDLPQPQVSDVVAPSIDEPAPQQPEAPPTISDEQPPDVPVQPAPELPAPAALPDQPVIDTEAATPPPADRVAPEIAPEQPDNVVDGPQTPVQAPADEPAPDTPVEPPAAPQEAAPEIVTEAETPQVLAPTASVVPIARPSFQQEPATEPTPDETPTNDDPIAQALAEAVQEPAPSPPTPTGPPLSRGEKAALRGAVGSCWNPGSLSTEALQTTVTIFVAMQEDGKPEVGSIRMTGFEGGSESAAKRAYEAARRAIIRCGARGFDLPREKYSQWREIEMIFNPNGMRMK